MAVAKGWLAGAGHLGAVSQRNRPGESGGVGGGSLGSGVDSASISGWDPLL